MLGQDSDSVPRLMKRARLKPGSRRYRFSCALTAARIHERLSLADSTGVVYLELQNKDEDDLNGADVLSAREAWILVRALALASAREALCLLRTEKELSIHRALSATVLMVYKNTCTTV